MTRLFALCLALLCAAAPASAQAPGPLSRYGVTATVGTTGPALAVTATPSRLFAPA